jgi:hypothetical protein
MRLGVTGIALLDRRGEAVRCCRLFAPARNGDIPLDPIIGIRP